MHDLEASLHSEMKYLKHLEMRQQSSILIFLLNKNNVFSLLQMVSPDDENKGDQVVGFIFGCNTVGVLRGWTTQSTPFSLLKCLKKQTRKMNGRIDKTP